MLWTLITGCGTPSKGAGELLRRSGTALLWIKTRTPPSYYRTKKQIPDILDTHWDQIQKLEVAIYNDLMDQSPLCRLL